MKKLLIITLITVVGVGSLHSSVPADRVEITKTSVKQMSMDQLKEALDRTKKKAANLRQQLRTAKNYVRPGIYHSMRRAENVAELLQKTIKKRTKSGKS